jgi:hypothetical protein
MQKQICALLAKGHTIKTVCEAVVIGERTYYDWCEKHPHFSQATTCAIGKSKIVLVDKLRLSDDWRAAAFLLERRWPDEFGRCDVRPLPPPEEKKKINVAFIVNTNGKSLQEVANFPVISTEEAMAQTSAQNDEADGEALE